jgi:hypothetical protein
VWKGSQPRWGALTTLLLLFVTSCATDQEPVSPPHVAVVLEPDALRAEVARRVPELPLDAIDATKVPYEIGPVVVEHVRSLLTRSGDPDEEVRELVRLVTAEHGLGLRYTGTQLGTAAETLVMGEGNCFSLAAVLVGLARGLGWRARLAEMTCAIRSSSTRPSAPMAGPSR